MMGILGLAKAQNRQLPRLTGGRWFIRSLNSSSGQGAARYIEADICRYPYTIYTYIYVCIYMNMELELDMYIHKQIYRYT